MIASSDYLDDRIRHILFSDRLSGALGKLDIDGVGGEEVMVVVCMRQHIWSFPVDRASLAASGLPLATVLNPQTQSKKELAP